jgi:16S rRNA (adenine1518-N6/adenine1519-N6)-dimethyltransferase
MNDHQSTNDRLPLPFADKSLGQHFLKDQKVIHSICYDFKDVASGILEIGPGPGILTETLASHHIPFHVIEKDTRFEVYLKQFLKNDQITMGDALNIDIEKFIKDHFQDQKNIWLVSNLPYNVGSPLLINFLQAPSIKHMTLMFQKEVADKVFPFATPKNYMNSLLVLSQTYFECKLLLKVLPGAFNPPPKVDSAVLSMVRKEIPLVPLQDFRKLEKFLRLMFSQKRKQLGGIMKAQYPIEKIHTIFSEENILETIRAEALTLDQVLNLYRKFSA